MGYRSILVEKLVSAAIIYLGQSPTHMICLSVNLPLPVNSPSAAYCSEMVQPSHPFHLVMATKMERKLRDSEEKVDVIPVFIV